MSHANELRLLTMKAHRALNLERNPDKARSIVDQVYAALGDLDGHIELQVAVHTSLASTFRDLDDPRAELMIRRALELQAQVVPTNPTALANQHLFYARWLLDHGRYDEAKCHAVEGEARYREGTSPDDPELQHVRALVAQVDTAREKPGSR